MPYEHSGNETKRKYINTTLLSPSDLKEPLLVFKLYGEVIDCISSLQSVLEKQSIGKQDLRECIRKSLKNFTFSQSHALTLRLAHVYNDFRRLGILAIGHGGNWGKNEEAKLTQLGTILLKCKEKIQDKEKIGAVIFYLCELYGDKVRDDEAGVCRNIWIEKHGTHVLRYNEQILLREAKKLVENFYLKNCRNLSFLSSFNLFDFIIFSTLISGKNLLLVGRPGAGKTSYMVELLRQLGIPYDLRTAHAEWTAYDVIGGLTVRGGCRYGFLTKAVTKCRDALKTSGRPHWVIIDEMNRADIDRALGEFFTMLDIEYRNTEIVICDKKKVKVPFAFRILGTMNTYDRTLLYKLGFAFRRRFALIDFEQLRNLNYSNYEVNKFKKKILEERECNYNELNKDKVLSTLFLSNSEENDYALVFQELYYKLRERKTDLLNIAIHDLQIDIEKILFCIVSEINEKGGKLNQCDVCPILIPPGVVADALRFLIAAKLLCDFLIAIEPQKGADMCGRLETWIALLDSALATFLLPQLDILAEYLQIEESSREIGEMLQDIRRSIDEYGLKLSSNYLERLRRGYNVP